MLPLFVNAIILLNTTSHYELYSGKTESGGTTTVTIEAKTAEGYNSQYFQIKQVVVEPGQQAYIQKFDLPSLEVVHKLILMSIEEGYHGKVGRKNISLNEGVGKSNSENISNNTNSTIPVIKTQSRPINKILSKTPIGNETISNESIESSTNSVFEGSEYPGGIDEGLESFMGGAGIKIANMRNVDPSTNAQAAASHRNSIENLLNDVF